VATASDSSYIRHVVGKLKRLHRLKYKLADASAGKLSTPETWARDTGACSYTGRCGRCVVYMDPYGI